MLDYTFWINMLTPPGGWLFSLVMMSCLILIYGPIVVWLDAWSRDIDKRSARLEKRRRRLKKRIAKDKEVEEKLSLLSALEKGWDGYDGDTISKKAIGLARSFLSIPGGPYPDCISGCADGGLSLDFLREDGQRMEMDFTDEFIALSWYGENHDPEFRKVDPNYLQEAADAISIWKSPQ